jgi:membrane protease YdiL (CAAX protease family)
MSIPLQISSPLAPAAQRWNALGEIALVVALFVLFLWGGRDLIPGSSVTFIVGMLVLLCALHRRSGETLAMIGVRWDTFGAALRWLMPITLGVAAAVLFQAVATQSARFPPWPQGASVLLTFIGSGLLQQYVLLGFFGRRFARVFTSQYAVVFATAAVFALLHLPNPFLTPVTFVAGLLCTAIYQRAPNLLASGLMHGMLSFVLSFGLPLAVNDAMRVGAHHIAL